MTIVERLRARLAASEALGLRVTGWVLTEDEWMAVYEHTVTRLGGSEAAQNAAGLGLYVPWNHRIYGRPIAGIRGFMGRKGIKRNPQVSGD